MIRKGKYALYNGIEYRFTKSKSKKLELISNNLNDLNKGFKIYAENVYVKAVTLNEIEKLFYIYSYAKYKGEEFPASQGSDGTILLNTSDTQLAKKLGFDRTDKYQYSKYVSYDEVDLFERVETEEFKE
jgi:hypothetical protein